MTSTATSPRPALLYSEDETALRGAVRELLADRSPWPDVLARTESAEPYDAGLWRRIADMGLTGLAIPEELGGAGASAREVAVVLEELGRSVAPTAYLGSAVLATTALLAVPGDAAHATLEALAGGGTAALAVPLTTAPGDAPFGVAAAGGALTGTVTSVADAATAQAFVVPALEDGEPALYLVAATAAGPAVEPTTSLDLTRRIATVRFGGAPGEVLARGEDATAAVEAALLAGAGLLASEQLGLAERCLELTVEHLRTRHQFGRPIGSFQGLKHRLADLWVGIAQARATARYAADRLALADPDVPVAVAVAQAHGSPLAVRAAEECVQLHGGLGFTWEHPAHLYLKRARSSALALGTADRHRARIAALVDLPPA